MDLVTQTGALLHEGAVPRDTPTQHARLGVGHPDLRDEVGGEELSEGAGVDLVGLDLGVRDRLGPQRVGDDDATGALGQQIGDRPGVGGGLEHDLVVRAECAGEVPQRLRLGRDAQLALLLPFEDRDLGEAAVDVEADGAHAGPSFSTPQRATRQLRIRARGATGQVAGRPNRLTDSQSKEATACPSLVSSVVPLSRCAEAYRERGTTLSYSIDSPR